MGRKLPNIRLIGDKRRALDYVRRGKQELHRTRELAKKSGDIAQRTTPLPDGEIITFVHGETEVITIDVFSQAKQEVVEKEEAVEEVLHLYSGLAFEHILKKDLEYVGVDPQPNDASHPTMEFFAPTIWTYESYRGDFPYGRVQQANQRLNVQAHTDLTAYQNTDLGPPPVLITGDDKVAQTHRIRPCMFSGLLAKAASIVLGHGDLRLPRTQLSNLLQNPSSDYADYVDTKGIVCAYEQTHVRTHGIVRALDKSLWLVEISEINGIIARPLPMLKDGLFSRLHKREKKVLKELGGVPSGESFPVLRADVLDGITEGWIKEIRSPSYLTDYYDDYDAYISFGYSWVFNTEGSEARNTTRGTSPLGYWDTSVYWKTVFNFDPENDIFTADTSIIREDIAAKGTLTWKSGIWEKTHTGTTDHLDIFYSNHLYNVPYYMQDLLGTFSTYDIPAALAELPDNMEAVIWVGWIDGAWSEIFYRSPKFVEYTRYLSPPTGESAGTQTGKVPYRDVTRDSTPPSDSVNLPVYEHNDWIYTARNYSTEIGHSVGWESWGEYQFDRVLSQNIIWGPGIFYEVGFKYGYTVHTQHYPVLWDYPLTLDKSTGFKNDNVQYITVPFNRNAYFCYSVTDIWEREIGFLAIAQNTHRSDFTLLSYGAKRANDNPTGPYPGEGVGTTTFYDAFPIGHDGGFGHDYINSAISTHIKNGDGGGPIICDFTSEPTAGWWVLQWAQALAGTPTPAQELPANSFVDGGAWWLWGTPSGCAFIEGTIFPFTSATTMPDPYGNSLRSYNLSSPYVEPGFYELTVWLVADRLPGGKSRIVFQTSNKTFGDYITATITGSDYPARWWCQTATIGAEGAIFTSFDPLPSSYGVFAYDTAGAIPPLPSPLTGEEYQSLTFVGFNGP